MRSVTLILLASALSAGAIPAQKQGIDWHADLAAARLKARETGRPLMIVFR